MNYEVILGKIEGGIIPQLSLLRRQEDHLSLREYEGLKTAMEKALDGGLSPEAKARLPRGDPGKTLSRRVARIYSFISTKVVEEKKKAREVRR